MAPRPPTVAVVLTTFNDVRFLPEALESVMRQTRPPDEVIVVDDGSAEDPSDVVRLFPQVRLLRQANQGLSAARNSGLQACRTEYVTFLDADDVLLPCALDAGLSCFHDNPDSAFVYGAFRTMDEEGRAVGRFTHDPSGPDAYLRFLRGNLIGMHATVLYRRDVLVTVGGFDVARRRCEDYDVFLRITRSFPVAAHPTLVAHYRHHGGNMSHDLHQMLAEALHVLRRQAYFAALHPGGVEALRAGIRLWRSHYASALLASTEHRSMRISGRFRNVCLAARMSPSFALRRISQHASKLVRIVPLGSRRPHARHDQRG